MIMDDHFNHEQALAALEGHKLPVDSRLPFLLGYGPNKFSKSRCSRQRQIDHRMLRCKQATGPGRKSFPDSQQFNQHGTNGSF